MAIDLSAFDTKKPVTAASSDPNAINLGAFDTFHAIKNGDPLPTDADKGNTWKNASALGKTWQVIKGLPMAAWQTIGGEVMKFGTSALAAPIDIARMATGIADEPMPGETGGVAGLPSTKTFQADAADYLKKAVNTTENPLLVTAKAVLPTVAGGASALGAADVVANPEAAAKAVYNSAKGMYEWAASKVEGVAARMTEKVVADRTASTIEAVNPSLTGKKLTAAYKDVATGQREPVPASIFKEQGLAPDQKAVNLGTRMSSDIELTDGQTIKPIQLGKDPVVNLKQLNTSLNDTEKAIDAAFTADPEVVYNADKPTLYTALDNAKIAREDLAIKDSKSMFKNVMDFAKKTIADAKDDLRGVRDGRTAFDTQAKTEYPNAFKPDGTIDTKTPAGRAIKAARDIINEHLYNTAPNGSDIQKLIGREADIYRATESIAPKAAEFHGKGSIGKIMAKHPTATKVAGYGTAAAIGGGLVDKAKSLIP